MRRRWITATCWALAALLVVALVLVGLDRVLGIADPFGRTVLTLTFVAAGVWIANRWRQTVSQSAATPLQIAHEVEQQHPALRDVVASAWEFAAEADDDPTAGSESLRRAVVLRAATAVDEVDWNAFVPLQQLRRALFGFAAVASAVCVLTWCLPQALGIGMTRLINPLSSAEWPREHNLQFVDPPELIAVGADLVLRLRDTYGELPESVTMHYRTRRSGRWHEESQPLAVTNDPLEIVYADVQQALEYRVVGGDHTTMPWHVLRVIPPPRVEQLAITVHPPAYTELPAAELNRHEPVYAGSKLELHGRVDQLVTRVELISESGRKYEAQLSSAGREFQLEKSKWVVDESDRYTINLTTKAGLTTRADETIAVEVITDQAPDVRFVEPTDDLILVPTAAVPIVVEARDELVVRAIDLSYLRSDRSADGEQQVRLWISAEDPEAQSAQLSRRIEYLLELEPLSVAVGTTIELHACATDAQPMIGQTARSVRIQVVSEDQLWDQLLDLQAELVETLTQLLQEQRELAAIVSEWAEVPDWSPARWASSAHTTLFRQRQIAQTLGAGQNSVRMQLEKLMTTIRQNNLVRPAAVDRLESASSVIQNLLDTPLATIENSLSELTRQTRRSTSQESLLPLIGKTSSEQQVVVAGLQHTIELLTPGNVLGRLERELTQIESEQQALERRTRTEVAPLLLRADKASADQQELLMSVARPQRELSRRFAEWTLSTSQAVGRLADTEPMLASRLDDTVLLAQTLAIQSTMQTAVDHLVEQRVGSSAAAQRSVLTGLAQLRALLAGQDAERADERFETLKTAERELARLRRHTSALEKQLDEFSPEQRRRELERLRREQEKLADAAEQMARQLERLRIPQAAKPASKAAAQLRRAKLDQETTKQARRQLDAAQRALSAERRRQQVTLARLQMAQLDAKMKAFIGQQQAITQEIRRLDKLRQASGQLTEPQQLSVRQLADSQRNLRGEVTIQADALASLPVFTYLLKQAADTMQAVEQSLRRAQLGPESQSESKNAVRQLSQIVESVRQEQQKLAESKEDGGGGGGSGEQPPSDTPQAQTLQLALGQLKLLKSLQAMLRDKTQALEQAIREGEQPAQTAEELAQQQQELTELARQLVPEPPDPPSEELIPNLEQELERSFDQLLLPNSK